MICKYFPAALNNKYPFAIVNRLISSKEFLLYENTLTNMVWPNEEQIVKNQKENEFFLEMNDYITTANIHF